MKNIIILVFVSFLFSGVIMKADAQLVNGGIYYIKNVASSMYAHPGGGSVEKGAAIKIENYQSDDSYKWKAIYTKGGYFKFQNIKSNYFLAVNSGSSSINVAVNQWADLSDRRQQDIYWKLQTTSKGFNLKNKNSNFLLAVVDGKSSPGAHLIQGSVDNAQDKIWQFISTTQRINNATGIVELIHLDKPNQMTTTTTGKKVLVDIILNYIATSESTRNQIDNGDCKRVFGKVQTEIWELDNNNEMKKQLASYNNMPELLFNQNNYKSPPPVALSYYQDNLTNAANNQMSKITYNLPENLLIEKKIMLVVKTYLGTRHKDNDFASYDCLKMENEKQSTFLLNYDGSLKETILANTDQSSSRRDMHFQDFVIPFAFFQNTDDTHNIWIKIGAKRIGN